MTIGRKMGITLVALDTCAVVLVFNLAVFFRGLGFTGEPLFWELFVPWIFLGAALHLIDGYRARSDMVSLDYTSTHTIALLIAAALTLLVTFVVLPSGYTLQQSRSVVALGFAALIPITLLYRRWIRLSYNAAHQERSLIFIGDTGSRDAFQAECARAGMKQNVVYVSSRAEDPSDDGRTVSPFPAQTPVIPLESVLASIRKGELPTEAIVLRESNRDLHTETSQRLVDLFFDGTPTYTLELFHQVYWRKIPLYRLNPTWLFQEGFRVAREPVFERLKRLSDIGFSLIGLILAAPILAAASIAIWLDDRGPALFRQTRIGRNRTPFSLYKLRTMRLAREGALYTHEGDTRITRVGRFLRSTRIDEIPQLLNVLRGQMSLIGPRAEWDRLVNDYERQIPCYHFRHLVRPGITGWAQVNYPYGANLDDTLRKLEYDLYYIRHFSFTLDASIVLKTVHVMLLGKGR